MVKYAVVTISETGRLKKGVIDMPKEFSIRKHANGDDASFDDLLWERIDEKIVNRKGYTLKSIKKVRK